MIPAAALAQLRTTTESSMRDTCTITRKSSTEPTFNPVTLAYTDPAPTLLYEGPCRVRHTNAGRGAADTPGQQVTLRQYEVTLPRDTNDVLEGDVLTVTVSDDAALIGRSLYVLAATWSAENLHRRLTLEDRQ